tara:strand:+ start:38 stop:529 length:492 start_codon:yes stop_codon:yes gene_type:complete
MKKIFLLIIITLSLTGCFKDKSEEAIKNCADTIWSEPMLIEFDLSFQIDYIYTMDYKTENIFDETILKLKLAGFTYEEVNDWAKELATTDINDANREIINYFIGEQKRLNNILDDHFKLPLSDRLQNRGYEKIFIKCERLRKKADKTFDAKWQKAKIKKVEFR